MKEYEFLKPLSDKIHKANSAIPQAEKDIAEAKASEEKFLSLFTPPYGKYILFGVLCLAALLFDFFVNEQTLGWLGRMAKLPVEIFAAIFMIIDACIAVLAAGLLADDIIDKTKHKKIWRSVLWGLGVVKIILFLVYVTIKQDGFGDTNWYWPGLQIIFVALIYIILDNAGSGLYYILGKFWHLVKQQIWYDNPEELRNDIAISFRKLNEKIKDLNNQGSQITKDEVYNHFQLNEVKQ
jgi:hypothetical protein